MFDGKVEYRGSLAKMKSNFHMLGLTQEVRKQLGKDFGDEVSVKLWEDKEERMVEIPEDVLEIFNQNNSAFGRIFLRRFRENRVGIRRKIHLSG